LAFSPAENAQASMKNSQRIQPLAVGDLKWAGFRYSSQMPVNCNTPYKNRRLLSVFTYGHSWINVVILMPEEISGPESADGRRILYYAGPGP
ncbi:MAG TPA: hypothetical protein IAA26_00005, partial [Candidatus Blautia faecipullorum]|nr:hypothetical protein [Candidatus Blautia faecipullorum]